MIEVDAASTPALQGIRVIEIGTFLSAPFAAMLLADFGADVIKIELPDVGDPMRTLGAYPPEGNSGYWWSSIGRNKRSLALDIRTAEGRELLGELLRTSNVLIENFRPGTLDRWGVTKDWMHEYRPDLVVVRISGYGQEGPWRDVPGFDRNAQAFSGLVHLTGEPDMPPQQAGLPVCDFTAGLWAAFGTVTALLGKLLNKQQSGEEIDLALYETMLPFLKDVPQKFRHQGKVTERTGNTPDYVSPGGAYQAGNGEWIFISGTGDRVFARFMALIGRPELVDDPMFRHNKDRVANRPALDARINEWLKTRTAEDVLDACRTADVPAVKIHSIADLMQHPQVVARGNFVDIDDHGRGAVCTTAPLPRLSSMPGNIRWAGQELGEATDSILRGELKLAEADLDRLRERRVIGG
jgi:crotonobetainyl-CoA:carnitine CoA-transferase CaiB-like acyl-CoA transferase